jgi:hypothetical protein
LLGSGCAAELQRWAALNIMGVIYSVFPVNNEVKEWLKRQDIQIPAEPFESRNATPDEVVRALKSIDGITVDYTVPTIGGTWQADITSLPDPSKGAWTLINMDNYEGNLVSREMWFEKGWPDLIILILKNVSSFTGPLMLLPDTGDRPLVVTPECNINEMLEMWNGSE